MKYSDTILVFFLAAITISIGHCANQCCLENVFRRSSDKCEDGKPIVIPNCAGYQTTLNNAWNFMTNYIIRNDTLGEYLDDYVGQFIVRSPSFCLADMKRGYRYNSPIQPVAVICSSGRIYYRDMKTQIDESDNPDYFLSYWEKINVCINFIAMFSLALTFYIYYLVVPTRPIEDICLLHFAGCSCLSHAALLYDIFMSNGLLPDACITHLYAMYFFILSSFIWYALFMYSVWKKFKYGLPLDDEVTHSRFRMIGYGVPTFVIILANIHAHTSKLYTEYSFEDDCFAHKILIENLYIYGPTLIAIGFNCFYWKDLATHVETAALKTTADESNKNTVRSLLTVNRWLFLVFGLPWLLFIIVYGAMELFFYEILFLIFFLMQNVFNVFGVFHAVILVMFRARIWKHVVHKYKNIQLLQKWQPSDEEEISVQSDFSSNASKTLPQEV